MNKWLSTSALKPLEGPGGTCTFSSSAAVQPPVSALVQLNKLCTSYSKSQNIFHQQELLYITCTKHQDSDVQHSLYFLFP